MLVTNARRDYHAWLAVLIVLALATIAVTLALARFITQPMRRLATMARSVSAGELGAATALPSGPRETADVGRAFGELVTNLRLLEAKTHALASCDFENPALREPLTGQLAPDAFIPVAEGSDLIVALDLWVLRQVAAQLIAWSTAPDLAGVAIAVNISGRHLLGGELDDHVRAVLEETGIEPERLILEITETVILADLPAAADQLERVRARGVRVAIDDFGTGYTSIAHLQCLPVDTIKIDRSFVRQVEEQREGSLVRMVTDLSHHIAVSVVAEGVETAGQRDVLTGLGCDQLQGFLFSRPKPAGEIPAWVAAIAGDLDVRGRWDPNSPPPVRLAFVWTSKRRPSRRPATAARSAVPS